MKQIKEQYSLTKIIIATFIGFLGGIILYSTNVLNVQTYEDLFRYVMTNLFELVLSVSLIATSINAWRKYFRNVIIKPNNEILYLLEIEENRCKFIDKKGNNYYIENNNYELDNYYNVLKTKDILLEIKEISKKKFIIPTEKKNFWKNFYTPIEHYENVAITPIIYLYALIGIPTIILLPGVFKTIGILWSIISLGLVIYDLIYKIKLNKGQPIEETKIKNIISIIAKIIKIIVLLLLNILFFIIYTNIKSITSKIIIIPFIIISIVSLFKAITSLLNKNNIVKILTKIQGLVTMLFFIGILLYTLLFTTQEEGEQSSEIFIIVLLVLSIYYAYQKFIKKTKIKNYTYNIINDVYNWMLSKEKDVEVRILKEKSNAIQIGDIITFNNQDKIGKYVKVKVTNKIIVKNIDELLNNFNVSRIMPNHTEEELKELMYKIYKEELNNKEIVAFEFIYLTSDQDK